MLTSLSLSVFDRFHAPRLTFLLILLLKLYISMIFRFELGISITSLFYHLRDISFGFGRLWAFWLFGWFRCA
jgi:hypothetical protein